MSNWTGRAVGWLFWRAPKRAVGYTIASNLALASDLGRRWMLFAVFGLYLWGMRWVSIHLVPPLRLVTAILLLLWFWHGINLVKWTIGARAYAARQRAIQREMYQTVTVTLPEQMRQSLMAAYQAGGDMRDYGPAYAQTRQMEADQADQVRGWVTGANGEQVPTGEWKPVTPMPKWL